MRWAEIILLGEPGLTEPLSAALTEIGCAGTVVDGETTLSADPFANGLGTEAQRQRRQDGKARVRGYLPVDDRLEGALEDLTARLERLRVEGLGPVGGTTVRLIQDADWADAWKQFFKPIRAGRRLVVKPTWEAWTPAPEDLIIEIDPGMAFGTGCHPTTHLCLGLLEELIRPGDRVLDWGCGSGILAIACVRLGASGVLALDLDPVAVRVSCENVALNDLTDRISVREASIEDAPSASDDAVDLIIANILADIILCGAGEIHARLRPGGIALLSGIIADRASVVCAGLEAAGLSIEREERREEWVALVAKRSAPALEAD